MRTRRSNWILAVGYKHIWVVLFESHEVLLTQKYIGLVAMRGQHRNTQST